MFIFHGKKHNEKKESALDLFKKSVCKSKDGEAIYTLACCFAIGFNSKKGQKIVELSNNFF